MVVHAFKLEGGIKWEETGLKLSVSPGRRITHFMSEVAVRANRLAALLFGFNPLPPKKKKKEEPSNMTLSMFCFILFHLLLSMRPAFKSGMYTYLDLDNHLCLLFLAMLGPYLAYTLCGMLLQYLLFQEAPVSFVFHSLCIFPSLFSEKKSMR